MRAAAFIVIGLLTGAVLVSGQRIAPPSRTLDLSIAVDTVHPCVNDVDSASTAVRVRLRFRNRGQTPLRVLPDTVRLSSVQIVRTIEEFVPMGADTPGVTTIPPAAVAAGKGVARLLAPGESADVVRDLKVTIAPQSGGDTFGMFEPGHYFLELVGVIESAAPGSPQFSAASVVSPYIEIDLATPGRAVTCR